MIESIKSDCKKANVKYSDIVSIIDTYELHDGNYIDFEIAIIELEVSNKSYYIDEFGRHLRRFNITNGTRGIRRRIYILRNGKRVSQKLRNIN